MSRLITRSILVLAAATAVLLLVGAVLGSGAMTEGHGEPGRWRAAHGRVGLATVAMSLSVLGLGAVNLRFLRRRIAATLRGRGLPGWPVGLADKAVRRADPFRAVAAILLVGAAVSGKPADPPCAGALWHAGLGGAALAFGVGALAVEVISLGLASRVARGSEPLGSRAASPMRTAEGHEPS